MHQNVKSGLSLTACLSNRSPEKKRWWDTVLDPFTPHNKNVGPDLDLYLLTY